MRVSELTGSELDFWVAKANGDLRDSFVPTRDVDIDPELFARVRKDKHHYSTNWEHGGPIIEREQINLTAPEPPDQCAFPSWRANVARPEESWNADGPTPLIAAMRAFVASKFGEDVEKTSS